MDGKSCCLGICRAITLYEALVMRIIIMLRAIA